MQAFSAFFIATMTSNIGQKHPRLLRSSTAAMSLTLASGYWDVNAITTTRPCDNAYTDATSSSGAIHHPITQKL